MNTPFRLPPSAPIPPPVDTGLPAELDPEKVVLSVTDYEDGSVDIDIGTPPKPDRAKADASWYANLAEDGDPSLASLAYDLLEAIDGDVATRKEWIDQYNQGLDLLGLKITPAGQRKKTTTLKHPLLMASCVRFQAQAMGELLPASGPVKVRDDRNVKTETTNLQAGDLENDFNHYLTVTATEYYPDMDRGLFYLGYGGTLFRKVYRCPIRNRPVSECVYAPDLIVSNDATDLYNADRVTHQIEMQRWRLEELQDAGVYVEADLSDPISSPTPTQTKEGEISGISATPGRPQDATYKVYECYCRIRPSKYGLGEEDEYLPFKVSIAVDAKKVLEVRRNWRKDDKRKQPRRLFVQYDMIRGMGLLGYGFLQMLGNSTKALTAMLQLMIDAGMFSNFPGGVRVKGKRLETNEIQPGPGEFHEIDLGGTDDIRKAIMALPYKEPGSAMLQMYQHVEEQAERLAGTASIETGDGRTNVPVGTIMAQIEQDSVIMTAVNKRLHQSQQQEFILLKELFAEDPEALTRDNPKASKVWTAEELEDADLVPASDPNVPAQTHRIMQAVAVQQLADSHPDKFNIYETLKRTLRTIGVGDVDTILPQPQPQADQGAGLEGLAMLQFQVEQAKIAAEAKSREADLMVRLMEKRMELAEKAQQGDKDRQSKEAIAAMNNQTQIIVKGLAQLGQPSSPQPARDQAFGP